MERWRARSRERGAGDERNRLLASYRASFAHRETSARRVFFLRSRRPRDTKRSATHLRAGRAGVEGYPRLCA